MAGPATTKVVLGRDDLLSKPGMSEGGPPSTVGSYVLERIRAGILEGRFPVGSRLNQETLAEEFGASIIPVRESLRRLEAEGLVTIAPRRGAYVADVSRSELAEVYRIREVLEGHAVRMAVPQLDDAQYATLSRLNTAVRKALRDGSGTLEALDREWHFALYEAAGSPMLLELIGMMWSRCRLYRHVFIRDSARRGRALDEHDVILKLCREHDAEGAALALQAHVRQAEAELVNAAGPASS
jgi:DNA-binding GntR family transcriptional regulator